LPSENELQRAIERNTAHAKLNAGVASLIQAKEFQKNRESIDRVGAAVRTQTVAMVASQAFISRQLESVENGIAASSQQLQRIGDITQIGFNEMSAGFQRITDQLKQISGQLSEIAQKLDAIHETLKNPLATQARELFDRGMEAYGRGLFREAVHDLDEAAKVFPSDMLTHYYLGRLFLFGDDEDGSVVDLHRAVESFSLAFRYAKATRGDDHSIIQYVADSAFFEGQARQRILSGSPDDDEMLRNGEAAFERARDWYAGLNLASREADALYELCRLLAIAGKNDSSFEVLKRAIRIAPIILVRALSDSSVDLILPEVQEWVRAQNRELRLQLQTRAVEIQRTIKGKELSSTSSRILRFFQEAQQLPMAIEKVINDESRGYLDLLAVEAAIEDKSESLSVLVKYLK